MTPDFPIAEFLAWVRTRPADERYCFDQAKTCAVAQFGVATGRPELVGVADAEEFGRDVYFAVNEEDTECTFGKLAVRLAALVPAVSWTRADDYLTDIGIVAEELAESGK